MSAPVALRQCRVSKLVLYTLNHPLDFAFRVRTTAGRRRFVEAEWAFDWPHLRLILKARNIPTRIRQDRTEGNDFALFEAKQKLGLSWEQLARAPNATARTLQNWGTGKETGQLPKEHATCANCSP